jgi:uncharacterized protein YbaR (Trm112 family)
MLRHLGAGALQTARIGAAVGRDLAAIAGERRRHRPTPPPRGFVLDVGAGQAPHPRADVVVEKYVVDSFERARGLALVLGKPLVVADAEALPFADGSFSYAIASHVLEHAINPRRFADELSRVGEAGFVQVPSSASEVVFGWPYHPWLIQLHGEMLVFAPKEFDPPTGGEDMHAAFRESPLVRLGWAAHRSRWHHSVHWRGHLSVEVTGERLVHHQADVDLDRTVAALERMVREGTVPPLDDRLRDVLQCPACGGALRWPGDGVRCSGCAAAYPVPGGVPVLLVEAARGTSRAAP